MTNLSFNGTEWIERVKVEMTDEQKAILLGEDQEARTALMEELKPQREQTPTADDEALAEAKYDEIKPEGNFQLIAFDCSIDDGVISGGIMNYRVNGNHKQTRF